MKTPQDLKNQIAVRLRNARKSAGYRSAKEVAAAYSERYEEALTPTAIYQCEAANNVIPILHAKRLSELYMPHTPVDECTYHAFGSVQSFPAPVDLSNNGRLIEKGNQIWVSMYERVDSAGVWLVGSAESDDAMMLIRAVDVDSEIMQLSEGSVHEISHGNSSLVGRVVAGSIQLE
jgi:hypothetical protein